MRRFKNNKKNINIIPIVIIIIIVFTFFLLHRINIKISPKLVKISEYSLETYNNHLIMDFISNDTLQKSELNDLVNLVKNKNGEIIAIDYDIENSYKVLKIITEKLYEIVSNTSYKDITEYDYDIKDDLVLFYPIGIASDYSYFNNLGPKIPIKIKFLSSLVTNLKTSVKNYGINNVLVEVSVDIDITDNIVVPFTEKNILKHYNVLLSSKIVMGKVPMYLGGSFENSSPILQK